MVKIYNVLICDDDPDIRGALRIYLSSNKEYSIIEAVNGREAIEIASGEKLHLILLDIMMPETDGITALARLREFCNVPVIILTAKSEDTDKILGLDLGADDYITKPFNPPEVMARVKSQLRRYLFLGGTTEPGYLEIGGIRMDDKGKEVLLDGDKISLTPTEYDILKLLMENPGTVFSPKEIYNRIWGGVAFGAENNVAVHIRHLREKLEINPAEPRYLKVVWGQGYKIQKEREK